MNLTARSTLMAAAVSLLLFSAYAGETYSVSLQEGDSLRSSGSNMQAVEAYEKALGQAANDTETALALSKQAEVYATDLGDCDRALDLARRAAGLPAEPVGRVTALQVIADCSMKRNQPDAAVAALEEAIKLPGVEWAMPTVALKLGDAYRETQRFNDAVATYRRVLTMNTDDNVKAVAQLNIGLTYQYNLINPGAARMAYDEAERLNPGLSGEIRGHRSRLDGTPAY